MAGRPVIGCVGEEEVGGCGPNVFIPGRSPLDISPGVRLDQLVSAGGRLLVLFGPDTIVCPVIGWQYGEVFV